MNKINILICDDNEICAQQHRNLISSLAKKNQLSVSIEIVTSGKKLLFFWETKYAKTDLIYMDLRMPGLDGLETSRRLREMNCMADIIFCTADDSRAIEAFDVDALHYILKESFPVSKFEEIFLKAIRRIERRNVEVISLSCAGEHRNVPIDDILYFRVDARIVTVIYYEESGISTFEFYSTLSKIEEYLYGRGFIRIHRSFLVAGKYVHKQTAQEVEMACGDILPLSRKGLKAAKNRDTADGGGEN